MQTENTDQPGHLRNLSLAIFKHTFEIEIIHHKSTITDLSLQIDVVHCPGPVFAWTAGMGRLIRIHTAYDIDIGKNVSMLYEEIFEHPP